MDGPKHTVSLLSQECRSLWRTPVEWCKSMCVYVWMQGGAWACSQGDNSDLHESNTCVEEWQVENIKITRRERERGPWGNRCVAFWGHPMMEFNYLRYFHGDKGQILHKKETQCVEGHNCTRWRWLECLLWYLEVDQVGRHKGTVFFSSCLGK